MSIGYSELGGIYREAARRVLEMNDPQVGACTVVDGVAKERGHYSGTSIDGVNGRFWTFPAWLYFTMMAPERENRLHFVDVALASDTEADMIEFRVMSLLMMAAAVEEGAFQ